MGEPSKRQTSDLHPNESEKKKMFLHITLTLDRLHSIAGEFEDKMFFSLLSKEGKNKSHFKIVESLLVTLDSLTDLKDSHEHLSVFCFELCEHYFSVSRSEKTLVITPAPSFHSWWFLLEGF